MSGSFRSVLFGSSKVGSIPLLYPFLSRTPLTNLISFIASALEDDTIHARADKVRAALRLWEIGLQELKSSHLLVWVGFLQTKVFREPSDL